MVLMKFSVNPETTVRTTHENIVVHDGRGNLNYATDATLIH